MSALSELLNQHIPEGTSSRELARLCEHKLSRQTFDNYRKGEHPEYPGDDVLRVFHDLLKIPMQKLRQAANQPLGEPEVWTPPPAANLMNKRQRHAVAELINSFFGAQGERHDLEAATQSDASPEALEDQEVGSGDDLEHPDRTAARIDSRLGPGEVIGLEEPDDRHQKRR